MVSLTILCSILITYVVLSQTLLSRSFAQRDPTVTFISGLMLIKSTVLLRKIKKALQMRKEIMPMNVWSSFNMKQIEQVLSLI